MTIEKNGKKWRVKKMYKGVTYRVSLDHKPTKGEAELLINEKIFNDDPTPKSTDTFLDSANKYISIKSNVLSPSTIRAYKSIIKNMSDTFKALKLSEISQERVQKEINDYSADHSAKSTSNLHGFIAAVLGVYKPSLRLNTTLPQKTIYEAYTPSEDEVKRVLAEVKNTEYEIPFRLGVYGLRRGEAVCIMPEDIKKTKDGYVLSITKSKVLDSNNKWVVKPIPKTTGSQREIYIDSQLAKMIIKQGYAFKDHPNRLNHHLHRVLRRLNIPAFRYHDLRAYYATMAHSLGIADKYIMSAGGWTSTNILNRVYKRTFQQTQIEANKSIAKHLKP